MRITVAHADAAHADAGTMVVAHADVVVHTTALADAAQKNAVQAYMVLTAVNLVVPVAPITDRADAVRSDTELTFGGRAILQVLLTMIPMTILK